MHTCVLIIYFNLASNCVISFSDFGSFWLALFSIVFLFFLVDFFSTFHFFFRGFVERDMSDPPSDNASEPRTRDASCRALGHCVLTGSHHWEEQTHHRGQSHERHCHGKSAPVKTIGIIKIFFFIIFDFLIMIAIHIIFRSFYILYFCYIYGILMLHLILMLL